MQALDAATLDRGFNQRRIRPTEVKGYEQMLSRMLQAPLESSERNKNWTLQQKLLQIKEQLGTQSGLMPPIPNMVEYEAAGTQQALEREEAAGKKEQKKEVPSFMQAQHDHLENLRRQMESQLPSYSRKEATEAAADQEKEGKDDKKGDDDSSSGEYTYGSDDDDDDDDEDESPKAKQIEEKGDKTGSKGEQIKDAPPTDAEILARFQQKQVDDFYSCTEGSFLSDLAQLKEIQE